MKPPAPLSYHEVVELANRSIPEAIMLNGFPYEGISDEPGMVPFQKIMHLFTSVPEGYRFHFLAANLNLIKAHQIYEKLFLRALTETRTNHHHVSREALGFLLSHCSRRRLSNAGQSYTGPGPTLTVYRGIAGEPPDNRPLGLSWTIDLAVACFFAMSNSRTLGLGSPMVVTANIHPIQCLAYTNCRQENEVVLDLPHADELAISEEHMALCASQQLKAWKLSFGRV